MCGQAEPGRFNPPGGFGAFGTVLSSLRPRRRSFQSAGRIWGFRNRGSTGRGGCTPAVSIRRADLGLSERRCARMRPRTNACFNPPGGFGAFGTASSRSISQESVKFQSAGRIWGFRNRYLHVRRHRRGCVSIRRADLGLSEPTAFQPGTSSPPGFNPPGGFGAFGTIPQPSTAHVCKKFQSAGRIWGFRNAAATTSPVKADPVSIRRADLGLSEPHRSQAHWNAMKCACFERLLELLFLRTQSEPMPLVYHSFCRIGTPCFVVRVTPGVWPYASPLDFGSIIK